MTVVVGASAIRRRRRRHPPRQQQREHPLCLARGEIGNARRELLRWSRRGQQMYETRLADLELHRNAVEAELNEIKKKERE